MNNLFTLENVLLILIGNSPSCSGGMISLHDSFLHFLLDIWKSGGSGGGGEEFPNQKARNAHQKIWICLLKETNVDIAWASLDPEKIPLIKQNRSDYLPLFKEDPMHTYMYRPDSCTQENYYYFFEYTLNDNLTAKSGVVFCRSTP